MGADGELVPPAHPGQVVVDLDDVLIERVRGRELLGAEPYLLPALEIDGDLRKGGGARPPAVANPLDADAGEVEGAAERAVELGGGRVGPAPEPVEVVGEAVAEVRLRADVGGGADVVVPHRQPVGGRQVQVGPHEDPGLPAGAGVA